MGALLALAVGVAFAGGGVPAGASEALSRAGGHLLGAQVLGALGGALLAGLHVGLDAAAHHRVDAVLGELLVLLEPRPPSPVG
jgi:hypothetical protein